MGILIGIKLVRPWPGAIKKLPRLESSCSDSGLPREAASQDGRQAVARPLLQCFPVGSPLNGRVAFY
jgi:hypothetical protein